MISLEQLYVTVCSYTFNFYLWWFSNTTGINSVNSSHFEIPGSFQFVKVIMMTHGLKIPELSPLYYQWKSRYIVFILLLFATCWQCVFSVGTVVDMFKQLRPFHLRNVGKGKGAGRLLKLWAVPQGCGELGVAVGKYEDVVPAYTSKFYWYRNGSKERESFADVAMAV